MIWADSISNSRNLAIIHARDSHFEIGKPNDQCYLKDMVTGEITSVSVSDPINSFKPRYCTLTDDEGSVYYYQGSDLMSYDIAAKVRTRIASNVRSDTKIDFRSGIMAHVEYGNLVLQKLSEENSTRVGETKASSI